jgi:hypothetical protein
MGSWKVEVNIARKGAFGNVYDFRNFLRHESVHIDQANRRLAGGGKDIFISDLIWGTKFMEKQIDRQSGLREMDAIVNGNLGNIEEWNNMTEEGRSTIIGYYGQESTNAKMTVFHGWINKEIKKKVNEWNLKYADKLQYLK